MLNKYLNKFIDEYITLSIYKNYEKEIEIEGKLIKQDYCFKIFSHYYSFEFNANNYNLINITIDDDIYISIQGKEG